MFAKKVNEFLAPSKDASNAPVVDYDGQIYQPGEDGYENAKANRTQDTQSYLGDEQEQNEKLSIKDIIGDKGKLLTENLEVSVSFYNDLPISVDLPNQVNCIIDTTDVALKGQTVSSSYKPAKLDNGLNIQVPPFIEAGDKIIVDTRNLEYIKKI